MAYKGILAAAFAAALMVGGAAEAQSQACRKQCDTRFSACSKRTSAGDACLKTWHSCKRSCQVQVATAEKATPRPPAAGATQAARR